MRGNGENVIRSPGKLSARQQDNKSQQSSAKADCSQIAHPELTVLCSQEKRERKREIRGTRAKDVLSAAAQANTRAQEKTEPSQEIDGQFQWSTRWQRASTHTHIHTHVHSQISLPTARLICSGSNISSKHFVWSDSVDPPPRAAQPPPPASAAVPPAFPSSCGARRRLENVSTVHETHSDRKAPPPPPKSTSVDHHHHHVDADADDDDDAQLARRKFS